MKIRLENKSKLTNRSVFAVSGKRSDQVLRKSRLNQKANGKWCSRKRGKIRKILIKIRKKINKKIYCMNSKNVAKKKRQCPNMLFRMKTTNKTIQWIFQSKLHMVRHHHHMPLLRIKIPSMKVASQCRCHHIHHRLGHLYSINSETSVARIKLKWKNHPSHQHSDHVRIAELAVADHVSAFD